MPASSTADTNSDSETKKKSPLNGKSSPRSMSSMTFKKPRILVDEDALALLEQEEALPFEHNVGKNVVLAEKVEDVSEEDEEFDTNENSSGELEKYDPQELMEELAMIDPGSMAAVLYDDADDIIDAEEEVRRGDLGAFSSPSSPTLIGRHGLGSEPSAVDVSPISPLMMLKPNHSTSCHRSRGVHSLLRLSPQQLREMDMMNDDDIILTGSSIRSPVAFNNNRPAFEEEHDVLPPLLTKTSYVVRLLNDSLQNDDELCTKTRARKKVRDFVIGLQRRHFYPYDPNDLSWGLPDLHPLKHQVEIVKVETVADPMSPSTAASGVVSGATAMSTISLGQNGMNHNQAKDKKKNRRGSVSSQATSPSLRGRAPSANHSSSVVANGDHLALPSDPSGISLHCFRSVGSSRPSSTSNHKSSSAPSAHSKCESQRAKFEADGSVYDGGLVGGLRHGLGVAGYWNGCIYVGEFRKGQEHGLGELRDASGALIFRGAFENGRICGLGTFYYADGSVYRGEMREGSRHGKGIIWYSDGSLYEGDFVHGVRSGVGTFIALDGSQYTGEWAHDVRHGKGMLKLSDGTTLDGQFKDNQPDGRCCVTFAGDGSVYEGGFKDGLKDGRGTYRFGRYDAMYEGRFSRDAIGGIGTIKLMPGVAIELADGKDPSKSEWLVPIDLQCEIRSVHLKAGFAIDGT